MSAASARQVWSELSGAWLRWFNRRRFEATVLRELPDAFVPAARFAYFRDWTPEERHIARRVERFRGRIAEVAGTDTIESLGSPRSGTFSLDERGLARGAPSGMAPVWRHARTGVRPRGGILLRRLASAVKARRILELGTNTGFSGCYFLSADTRPALVTVEGSDAMCAIARVNLARFSSDVLVVHRLFDEAIQSLRTAGERFDCVYIDGQHEGQAVLHYAERVAPLINPGGAVIFDDLYWSGGMNQAWREICRSTRYRLTIDFGLKGVAVAGLEPHRHVDLCEFMGRPAIGRPDW
jgi:predicted O-methyltransferase YrrM